MGIFDEVTTRVSNDWSSWGNLKEGWYVDVRSGAAFVAAPLAKKFPIYILSEEHQLAGKTANNCAKIIKPYTQEIASLIANMMNKEQLTITDNFYLYIKSLDIPDNLYREIVLKSKDSVSDDLDAVKRIGEIFSELKRMMEARRRAEEKRLFAKKKMTDLSISRSVAKRIPLEYRTIEKQAKYPSLTDIVNGLPGGTAEQKTARQASLAAKLQEIDANENLPEIAKSLLLNGTFPEAVLEAAASAAAVVEAAAEMHVETPPPATPSVAGPAATPAAPARRKRKRTPEPESADETEAATVERTPGPTTVVDTAHGDWSLSSLLTGARRWLGGSSATRKSENAQEHTEKRTRYSQSKP